MKDFIVIVIVICLIVVASFKVFDLTLKFFGKINKLTRLITFHSKRFLRFLRKKFNRFIPAEKVIDYLYDRIKYSDYWPEPLDKFMKLCLFPPALSASTIATSKEEFQENKYRFILQFLIELANSKKIRFYGSYKNSRMINITSHPIKRLYFERILLGAKVIGIIAFKKIDMDKTRQNANNKKEVIYKKISFNKRELNTLISYINNYYKCERNSLCKKYILWKKYINWRILKN